MEGTEWLHTQLIPSMGHKLSPLEAAMSPDLQAGTNAPQGLEKNPQQGCSGVRGFKQERAYTTCWESMIKGEGGARCSRDQGMILAAERGEHDAPRSVSKPICLQRSLSLVGIQERPKSRWPDRGWHQQCRPRWRWEGDPLGDRTGEDSWEDWIEINPTSTSRALRWLSGTSGEQQVKVKVMKANRMDDQVWAMK